MTNTIDFIRKKHQLDKSKGIANQVLTELVASDAPFSEKYRQTKYINDLENGLHDPITAYSRTNWLALTDREKRYALESEIESLQYKQNIRGLHGVQLEEYKALLDKEPDTASIQRQKELLTLAFKNGDRATFLNNDPDLYDAYENEINKVQGYSDPVSLISREQWLRLGTTEKEHILEISAYRYILEHGARGLNILERQEYLELLDSEPDDKNIQRRKELVRLAIALPTEHLDTSHISDPEEKRLFMDQFVARVREEARLLKAIELDEDDPILAEESISQWPSYTIKEKELILAIQDMSNQQQYAIRGLTSDESDQYITLLDHLILDNFKMETKQRHISREYRKALIKRAFSDAESEQTTEQMNYVVALSTVDRIRKQLNCSDNMSVTWRIRRLLANS